MSATRNAPVIIKRKKVVGGGGHHGGAWKVAYADFVTAMMAFFMLMWLLNATTEKQRKGIADYFNPTIPINRISGGGEGSFGGTNIFSEQTLAQDGTGASRRRPTEENQSRGASMTGEAESNTDPAEDAALQELEDALTGRSGESMVSEQLARHIVTRITDEGLIIELFDAPDAALFEDRSAEPTELMHALAGLLSELVGLARNGIAVEGYTRARAVVLAENPVWSLSSARADRTRQLLEADGVAAERIRRVTGHADRKPVVRDTMAVRNNRIEVILLRSKL